MKRKSIAILMVFILSFLLLNITYAADPVINLSLQNDNIVIEGILSDASVSEQVSLLVINGNLDFDAVKQLTVITNEIAYLNQFTLDDNKSFSVSVPFDENFLYGNTKIYIGAPSLAQVYCFDTGVVKLDISKSGNGTLNAEGEKKLIANMTYQINATPVEGSMLDYIQLNGTKIYYGQTGEVIYTTPSLNADTSLEINFGINYTVPPATMAMSSISYSSNLEEIEKYMVSFSRAMPNYGTYTRSEFGIYFSKTELDKNSFIQNIESSSDSIMKFPGESDKINAIGQYGVKLYGSGIIPGNTYYTLTYAVYVNDSNPSDIIIVYGDNVNSCNPL